MATNAMEVMDEVLNSQNDNSYDEWDELDASDLGEENDSNIEAKSEEAESSDSRVSSSEDRDEDNEAPEEVNNSKEEDSSGKEESDSKDSEGLIEVKVDGELQKVSLDELKSNYAGKVAWDKRFSEVDRERKQVLSERDALQNDINSVNDYVAELGNKMRNVSMLEGLYEIGSLNNIGPHAIKKAIIDELLPEINKMMDMPEDMINLEYQKQELEYQKNLQMQEQQRFQSQQAQRELQQKVESLMQNANVSSEEYQEAQSFLNARKNELGQEVTPELVVDYAIFAKAESRADNLLNSFENGTHAGNDEVMNGVIDMILQYPEFTDEDVMDVIQDALSSAKQDVAQKQVEEVINKKSPSKPKSKKKEQPMMDDSDLDDWDDLL